VWGVAFLFWWMTWPLSLYIAFRDSPLFGWLGFFVPYIVSQVGRVMYHKKEALTKVPVLDEEPGNANTPEADRAMRSLHSAKLVKREAVFFSFYMDAPHIVDWLKAHGVDAKYEQLNREGVSILLPNKQRAYVGDSVIVKEPGHASVYICKAYQKRTTVTNY
jgi:hypothetical protein